MKEAVKEELVSVIITTYKRPVNMVYRAVKSVLDQTYKKIEVIVVDDSPQSFEGREAVKNKIEGVGDTRVTYLLNEKNIGACASRNRAIKASSGEYVIYVDDDDELLPSCIEKRVKRFTSSSIGLVYSDCYFVDELLGKEYVSKQKKLCGMVFDELIIENFIMAFPMLRRECFERCGYFDERFPASQDWDMWLRVAQKYEIAYVDEPLSRVHLHSNERITTNTKKKVTGLEMIYESNRDYIIKNPHVNHLKTKELVPYYIADGQMVKGIKTLLKAIKLEPLDIQGNMYSFALAGWGILKQLKSFLVRKLRKK